MANKQTFLESLIGFTGPKVAGERREQEKHDIDIERMQSLIDSSDLRTKIDRLRLKALEDPAGAEPDRTQAAIDLGKVADARKKTQFVNKKGDLETPPETAAFFDQVEAEIKSKAGFVDPVINPKSGKPRRVFDPSGEVVGTRAKSGALIPSEFFQGGVDPFETGTAKKATPSITPGETPEVFQASTPLSETENIPKSFEELGINNADDQNALQEMQKAAPEADFRKEFEQNPAGMKRLLDLWKAKGINKAELLQIMSSLQNNARQSLGIA